MTEIDTAHTWTERDEDTARHLANVHRFEAYLATQTPAGTAPAAASTPGTTAVGAAPEVGGMVEGAQHGAHPSPQDGIPYANEVEPDDEPDRFEDMWARLRSDLRAVAAVVRRYLLRGLVLIGLAASLAAVSR